MVQLLVNILDSGPSFLPVRGQSFEFFVEVEDETGLDFLHGLPDDFENLIETSVWEIWPDLD